MEIKSFKKQSVFNDQRVAISVILESHFSKELRLLFKKGQTMKEHKTPYPIVVHLLSGAIDFGVNNEVLSLKPGDIISLEGNVAHDLLAKEESVLRLSLFRLDKAERVENVTKKGHN